MKWRFILFVFVVAVLPALLAVLTTGDVALRAEGRLDERLTGSLSAFNSRFEAEGARRRELLLRLSALEALTQPVREAAREGTAPGADALARVRTAVGELLAPREVPELVALATANGAQVVLTSGEPHPVATADLPLAVPTIRDGQMGETLAVFEGALFRLHAAPLGIAEGAVVVGDRIGENSANRWRDAAKAQHLTLVSGGQPVVSTLPEALRADIARTAENPSNTLATGWLGTGLPSLGFLDPLFPVMVPGERWRSAAMRLAGGVTAVVTIGTEVDVGWLGRMQAIAFGISLAALLVGLLWLPVIYGPVSRQARSIEAHLARLRVEREAKLTERGFTKPFASVARELDRLTDDWHRTMAAVSALPKERPAAPPASEAPRPPPKPLDLPLAPVPDKEPDADEGTPSAFPFGEKLAAASHGPLDPPAEPLRAAANAPPPPPAAAKLSAPPPARGRPLSTTESLDPPAEPDAGPIPLPAPPSAKPAGADPFAAFGPAPVPAAADRTREAAIPEELLARSRELEQELLESPADPDEDHFREVFEEFVATRKKCGEPPDGLTLDKFTARLKKNREQLVAKYNCRTVRFQVYVKDGKAAVKAAPVR